jgi:hypothetical protein
MVLLNCEEDAKSFPPHWAYFITLFESTESLPMGLDKIAIACRLLVLIINRLFKLYMQSFDKLPVGLANKVILHREGRIYRYLLHVAIVWCTA